jgi:hypothetical protein
MRKLLLITALAAVTAHGEEAGAPTMRQKLHARIMESAPPPAPAKSSALQNGGEEAVPAVVMNPVVVSESKLVREVTAALEREKQNRQEERFSPLQGGKIANLGPMQLGGWWIPGEGWTFLRLNKAPSPRQAAAVEAMLKDLQALADLAEGQGPAPKPNVTKFPWWRRTRSDC